MSLLCLEARNFRLLLLFVGALFLPTLAEADEFRLLPSFAESLSYNDNIFLDSSHMEHDFISTTSGGLQLLDKTERLDLDVSARIDQLLYRDNTSLNSTDQFYIGNLRYSLSPKFSLSARGTYTLDSRPDRDLEVTGLPLTAVREKRYSFGTSGSYAVTDKTIASLSYDHTQDLFNSRGFRSFSDLRYDAGSLSFTHDFTQFVRPTKGILSMGYVNYVYGTTEVNNYQATVGVRHSYQEKWSILMDAGLSYTESTFPSSPLTDVTRTQWGAVGHATLDYRGEHAHATFTAGHELLPATGIGTTERTFVIFAISRRFAYELSGRLSAGYFYNNNTSTTSSFSSTRTNSQTMNISPGMRYEFNRDTFLEASYFFTRIDDDIANTTINRNLFLIRFFIQHTLME
jgi:hypothetical protein